MDYDILLLSLFSGPIGVHTVFKREAKPIASLFTFKTMKSIFVYIAAIAIAMNVAGNLAANTAEGLKASQAARVEKLCAVNPVYCE